MSLQMIEQIRQLTVKYTKIYRMAERNSCPIKYKHSIWKRSEFYVRPNKQIEVHTIGKQETNIEKIVNLHLHETCLPENRFMTDTIAKFSLGNWLELGRCLCLGASNTPEYSAIELLKLV